MLATLSASLLFLASGAQQQAERVPAFPVGVELVRIDVVVIGRDGQPVRGLTTADFEITEQGQPRQVVSFDPIVVESSARSAWAQSPATAPVSEPVVHSPERNRCFLVFFDDVHVSAPASQAVRANLVRFLQREMHAGDWVRILSPMAGLDWTARTPFEYEQIPAAIERLKGQLVRDPFRDGLSDFDAMNAVEYGGGSTGGRPRGPTSVSAGDVSPGGRVEGSLMAASLRAEERYAVAQRRIHRTLGALAEAVASLAAFPGRKSLILYSEGFIRAPHIRQYDEVIERARLGHVAIYLVDPRGLRSGLAEADASSSSSAASPLAQLETEAGGSLYLAIATGGRASISNDVTALFQEAALESSSYYLLGFQPSPGPPGDRKIKVRVGRDGLTVLAPDRYVVGTPAVKGRSKTSPAAVQAVASVADATDLRPRVTALFQRPSQGKESPTTIAIELDLDQPTEQRFDLLVEARPLGRGPTLRDSALVTIPAGNATAHLTRELRLAPGVWQVRVVVRDVRTDKLGSVLHTFEVPGSLPR